MNHRRVLSAIVSIALLIPALAFSAGPVLGLTCPTAAKVIGTGTVRVILYEMGTFDLIGYPDAEVLCIRTPSGTTYGVSNLKNVPYDNHAPSVSDGICDGQLATSYGTWNDCTSAFKVQGDCHYHISLYRDASYGGPFLNYSSSYNDSTLGAWNDLISSVKVSYSSACQLSAEL